MEVTFTQPEHDLVLHILQSWLGELRQEIHHSTVSTFTDELRERENLLKGVIDKLGSVKSGSGET